jgi:hypothetical protein
MSVLSLAAVKRAPRPSELPRLDLETRIAADRTPMALQTSDGLAVGVVDGPWSGFGKQTEWAALAEQSGSCTIRGANMVAPARPLLGRSAGQHRVEDMEESMTPKCLLRTWR